MGDPNRADPALLPDNFSCDHPDWRYVPGYLHYSTNYLLIADNLLDFSHLSYVHAATLGGSTAIAQARPTIEKLPQGIKVSRHISDIPPPGYYRQMRHFEGNVDRWFIYDFLLPGTLLMHSGARPVGASPDDESNTVRLHSCQTLTPETETSTHYFFQQACRVDQGGDAIARVIYDQLVVAFDEDQAMITAQARNLAARPEAPLLPLHMDGALTQFRRLLARRVEAEAHGQ
jgi:vanillate O-demethylase monooxygenase subunit